MNKRISRVGGLCLTVLAFVVGGCQTEPKDDPALNVLLIGNSFSVSLMQQLPQVAADCGIDLDLASLCIGGCSLQRHWTNVEQETKNPSSRPYWYQRTTHGKWKVRGVHSKLSDVLKGTKWDVVTIQQASHDSWMYATYDPYGGWLVAKIRELAPQARIVVQETWSYTPWDKRLKKWAIDLNEMYAKLHAAYADFAKAYELEVLPFGTAVQTWRRRLPVKYTENSFGGDVVGGGRQDEKDQFRRNADNDWEPNCDVFHLNQKGEYFQALVWARWLLDAELFDMAYRPEFVTESDQRLMIEIAMEAK